LSHFKTITDVVNGLTNNKIYPYQLEKMVLTLYYKEQAPFRNNLIDFANLFVSIFGAAVFKKLIYNLEINNSIGQYGTVSNNQVLAFTKLKGNGNDLAQCLVFTEHSLQARMCKIQYQIGFHSTATNISTIVHEIGHAISNYAWVWPNNRLRFNHNITPATGRCTPTKDKSLINIRGFMYSPNDSLVRYLGKQVGISNNAPFQQQLAAWAFIQSGYGRTGGNAELFAEGFAQWLLTPDDQKGLNWQILND